METMSMSDGMKRIPGFRGKALAWLVSVLLLTLCVPGIASAYSYGDPNEEAVAESYKRVAALLNQSPPDYTSAMNELKTIREELDMHMGKEPGQAIEQALMQKNKAAALDAFQKTLVLNIARRLDNAETDFANYSQGKLLLSKARAAYEALSPIVKAQNAALDETIRGDFDKALQSLGNPGLFGVGMREPDLAQFQSGKKEILDRLQAQFHMKSLEVGHFDAGGGGNAAEGGPGISLSYSQLKNWLPIAVLVLLLIAIWVIARRRRRK